MKVSWLAIELCLIACLYVTKHHLFTQNSNLISRSINITRSLHVKQPTLNINTWLPGRAIKFPPHPGAVIAKFGLDLIRCTPRDKIHVVYHTGEPLYYSRIRSFKFPTIPSPITTSLPNKTSLNIIFTQFCVLLSHQNAHQNKIYSLNTTTDFCVASAKLRPLPCGTSIFAGV